MDDDEVQREIKDLIDISEDAEGALGAALFQGGADVATTAGKYTPVDTGNLRGSTYVGPPEGSGGADITVKMGQGAEYAAARHAADTGPGSANNARAKDHWWRKAIAEESGAVLKKIAVRARFNLENGITFGGAIPQKIAPSNRNNPNKSTGRNNGAWQ